MNTIDMNHALKFFCPFINSFNASNYFFNFYFYCNYS